MIKQKVQGKLNYQLNRELYSSYLYLSMSAYFESVNLKGFANWMRVQAEEELMHALKFYDYIAEMGGRITLSSIEEPSSEWGSPLKVFQHVYEHEQKVTGLIHDLVSLAISEKDQATNSFLQWFVKEQVEEEESASEVVEKIKLAGDATDSLSKLDSELGQRVFTPPASKKGG